LAGPAGGGLIVSAARALTLMLRAGGLLLCSAAFAVVMPREAMVATNAWLGLAPLPEVPLTFYLARSTSALYALHGAVLLLASRDPVHYRALIRLLGATTMVFGVVLFGIDWTAGLPAWWTWAEGPGVLAIGGVLLALERRLGPTLPARGL
jgi:hypothetical protein